MEDVELAQVEPQAEPGDAHTEVPVTPVAVFPCNVLVAKYGDSIPVQCKDRAAYDLLVAQHGEGNIEVQS